MDNKPYAVNMNSCISGLDPQQQLGQALAQADICSFRLALHMGAEPALLDDKHTSVYEKALKTHGCAEFVEECLNHGCNPNYINQHLDKSAINFAADSKDPLILSILLRQKGATAQIDRKYAGLTALNSLAKNLTAENAADTVACMRLLLSYGASANIPDQREMTPLHYVLKNRKIEAHDKRELVQMFLKQCPDLDIDSYRDGEVRSILREEYADLELPTKRSLSTNVDCLLTHIRSGDNEKFLQYFEEYRTNTKHENSQDQLIILLIESIKRFMHDCFNSLLESGVNINQLHNGNSVIEIAVLWGNWLALQKLLNHEDLKIREKDQLLINVIQKLDEVSLHERCDYTKCFYVLLESNRVDVNETDHSGSTALHYAVKYRNRKAIQELLKRGAYIGMKSKFSDLPIDDMHADILEEHFNHCITTNGLKTGDQNFELIMNYKNLMPHQADFHNKAASQQLHDEMSPIAFLAESKEHRYLLQHPLITSFLFLKWQRLSAIFYINFLFYVFFAVSIITHTVLKFRESEHEHVTALFGIFSWIGIVYLLVRELIQCLMSPFMYFRSPINYMEIALILLSIMTCTEPTYDRETQRLIAVCTILLVAMELCLLVGSLPVLSISTHMLMLRAVSTSFIKSFTLYSIFVITFSLCFYILFGKPEVDENGEVKTDGQFNKFSNPFAAVIKTIVMLTGEFDAGDIDFDTLYSYLIFLLFVFFMSIVLFNLLNGLAVSDTQAIKAQAELNGSICRANVLARYEEVLTGRSGRVSFIVKHEPFRSICRRLLNVYPNYISARQIIILPNDSNKVMIPVSNSYEMSAVLKRGDCSRNSKTIFLPVNNEIDERQKKVLDPPVRALACCCPCVSGHCSEMDNKTVKAAICVVEQKTTAQLEKTRLKNTERRFQRMEQKLDRMYELLQEIQMK